MPQMTEPMAREILRVGAKYEAWEGATIGQTPESIPLEQAYVDAAELVKMARSAHDNGSVADAVKEILFAAQVEPSAGDGQPSGDPAPAPAEGGAPDISSIYPGYDEQKAKDIVTAIKESAASGDLSREEWAAIKAYEAANEERKSILELEPNFQPKPVPAPAAAAPAGDAPAGDYASAKDLERAYGDGSLGMDRITQEHLPIPPVYSGDEPVLPVDITAISHQELSRLAMTFHSLEARTLHVLSQEEGRAEAATSLRQDAHRAAFSHHFEQIKGGIEKQTGTALEAARSEANKLADDDQAVTKWRSRERRHGIEARSIKGLLDGYERATARLSREQTRREKLASTNGS